MAAKEALNQESQEPGGPVSDWIELARIDGGYLPEVKAGLEKLPSNPIAVGTREVEKPAVAKTSFNKKGNT